MVVTESIIWPSGNRIYD